MITWCAVSLNETREGMLDRCHGQVCTTPGIDFLSNKIMFRVGTEYSHEYGRFRTHSFVVSALDWTKCFVYIDTLSQPGPTEEPQDVEPDFWI